MGDVRAFVLAIEAVLIASGLLLGWINYKIDKLKEEDKLNIDIIGSIITLEKAMKKLNEALKSHDRRLDNHLHEISDIKDRLDILESGHPDSDIDYATLDDHDEVVEVWFEGKKYVPEDTRAEETNTFYADNKVVAETTRPEETRCCATCQYYRPGPDHTCTIRPWLRVTKACANNTHSACNNYAKAYTPTKGQVDYPYITYEYMSGNCKTEQVAQRLDELQRELQKFNFAMSIGACTVNEFERRWEELIQNDT